MPRTLLAGLTGLLAAVLLPLSIVSVWVENVGTDTDRYVETVSPLADDPVVQEAAAAQLEQQALRVVQATTGTDLPGVTTLVHLAVERVVESAAFKTAWVRANRTAHEQVMAVLEGRSSVVLDDQGRVTIELGTVLDTILDTLADRGLVDPGTASEVHASFPVMQADQLAKVRRGYDALETLGIWLPIAWVVLVILTLVVARGRFAALAGLAVASLVALGIFALALLATRHEVTSGLPEPEVAEAVWDVVVTSLWRAVAIVAGVLAVMALAAGAAGVMIAPPRMEK
ncbi:MAG TPA: hypothetical protein PK324_22120, partial [Nocardioides sp.]|nr:hypothetical protein [Nocardioides sp.]